MSAWQHPFASHMEVMAGAGRQGGKLAVLMLRRVRVIALLYRAAVTHTIPRSAVGEGSQQALQASQGLTVKNSS